jgi:branched-chain amino acid transport system substrate-binding protein
MTRDKTYDNIYVGKRRIVMKKDKCKILYIPIFLLFVLIIFAAPLYAEKETIKIGVTLSLTGKFSVMGNDQKNGYKLWESHVNSRGGLLGRKVEVVVYDDKSDPETAKALYGQMIVKEKMDFLFSPYSSPITEAILPITEKYNYPLIISGAGADSLWEKNYKNAIGTYTPSSRVSHGFIKLLLKNNIKKIAVVHADDAHSTYVAKGAVSWSEKLGMEVLVFESFKKDTKDLTYLAQKVRDSGAEALLVGGHLNEAIDMRMAVKAVNYFPKAYFASVGGALDEYKARIGYDANYTFASSLFEVRANFPGAKRFHEDYLKVYKQPPQYHAALAYAGGQVLEEAIKRTKTFDGEKVRETLFKMDIITIIGRFGIDKTGKQVRQHVYVIQWRKGKKEIVWPEKLATIKPAMRLRFHEPQK